jgi:hypothetical protein
MRYRDCDCEAADLGTDELIRELEMRGYTVERDEYPPKWHSVLACQAAYAAAMRTRGDGLGWLANLKKGA